MSLGEVDIQWRVHKHPTGSKAFHARAASVLCCTNWTLGEIEQGGDQIVVVAVVVVAAGWTAAGSSMRFLWSCDRSLCLGLSGVWGRQVLCHACCPFRILCLWPFGLVLQVTRSDKVR